MKLMKYENKLKALVALAFLCLTGFAYAQSSGNSTIGDLAANVTTTFENLGLLMIAAAYIGGFALVIAAIFKFKQHKDNPTQIPLGTPIALLIIGVILVFLPTLFGTTGETIFGSEKQTGGFGGEGANEIGNK